MPSRAALNLFTRPFLRLTLKTSDSVSACIQIPGIRVHVLPHTIIRHCRSICNHFHCCLFAEFHNSLHAVHCYLSSSRCLHGKDRRTGGGTEEEGNGTDNAGEDNTNQFRGRSSEETGKRDKCNSQAHSNGRQTDKPAVLPRNGTNDATQSPACQRHRRAD